MILAPALGASRTLSRAFDRLTALSGPLESWMHASLTGCRSSGVEAVAGDIARKMLGCRKVLMLRGRRPNVRNAAVRIVWFDGRLARPNEVQRALTMAALNCRASRAVFGEWGGARRGLWWGGFPVRVPS